MSPEQLRGLSVDARSDIFSFGCVLYELLCGRRAFSGVSAADTVSAILKEQPEPIVKAQAPSELLQIIKKCLAKNAEQRFASGDELLRSLKSLREEVSHPQMNVTKELSRNLRKPFVALPILLLILVIGFVSVRFFQKRQKIEWARKTIPEINNLIETEDFTKAFQLASQVKTYIQGNQNRYRACRCVHI